MKLKNLKEERSALSKEERKEMIIKLLSSMLSLGLLIAGSWLILHYYGWKLLIGMMMLLWSSNIAQEASVRKRFKAVGGVLKMLTK
jgi:CHASE2 domain-containing sensor protein